MEVKQKLTMAMVFAAGRDAGNRSMRAAGRAKWGRKDFAAACDEFNRLAPEAIDCEPGMRRAILAKREKGEGA